MPFKGIKSITIKNFKAFQEQRFDFDGKHVLLYGNNGSGKSSLYWAIYTFLQSAIKRDNVGATTKYFVPPSLDPEFQSLMNIYAPAGSKASIQIEWEGTKNSSYKVSDSEVDVREIINESTLIEASMASDFISYKLLQNFYDRSHKFELNLWPVFWRDIWPFISFGSNTFNSLRKEIESLKRESKTWGPKVKKNFEGALSKINNFIINELDQIEIETNKLLTTKFEKSPNGVQVKIFLSKPLTRGALENFWNQPRGQKTFPDARIKLILSLKTSLNGSVEQKERPQSLLNDARLSKIALAIRLAAVTRRIVKTEYKILCLDDLLLSLDLGNREQVFDLIFDNYSTDYQIFFFTHQRGLFEDARKLVALKSSEDERLKGEKDNAKLSSAWLKNWCAYEMFEGEDNQGFNVPKVFPWRSNIGKAVYYFRDQIDYAACGNNLRSAFEEHFRKFIPYGFAKDKKQKVVDLEKALLSELLRVAKEYYLSIRFDLSPLNKLDVYRERSLNSASHFSPIADYYKEELREIFELYNLLIQNKNDEVVTPGQIVTVRIRNTSGHLVTTELKFVTGLRAYREANRNSSNFLPSDIVKCELKMQRFQRKVTRFSLEDSGTLATIYNKLCDYQDRGGNNTIRSSNIYDAFECNGKTFNDLLQVH